MKRGRNRNARAAAGEEADTVPVVAAVMVASAEGTRMIIVVPPASPANLAGNTGLRPRKDEIPLQANADSVAACYDPFKEGATMEGRQKAKFQKRQKEVKRLEKQRQKAEKRAARKLEKTQPNSGEGFEIQHPFEDGVEGDDGIETPQHFPDLP